jgi:hypothetical protein
MIRTYITQEEAKMKKVISTIVVLGLVSNMLANTAFAGDLYGRGIDPLWVPVAILTTLAATVAIAQAPAIHEHRVYPEPRQRVIYAEPRHYRHEHYYARYYEPSYARSYGEREHAYQEPRYREYR